MDTGELKSGKDRRTELRHRCNLNVECSFLGPVDCEKQARSPWKTFTSDVSFSGMGLYSECPAPAGQKMMVNLEFVFRSPRMAEVRWCERADGDLYRLGVRFV
jgi:hypothetical protein